MANHPNRGAAAETAKAFGATAADALAPLFQQAMQEGADRERAGCIAAMRAYHEKHMTDLDDLATWEALQTYIEVISPGGQPGRTREASPF